MSKLPEMAADALLTTNVLLIVATAVLVLSGCTSVNDAVTCRINDFEFTCGIDNAPSQDLRANLAVAKDEKPVRTFTGPLLRLEEAPS